MIFKIVTPTLDEEITTDIMTAKMHTASLSDTRDEMAQLYDNNGNLLQTSLPMMVKNNDYDMMVEGYKGRWFSENFVCTT